MVRLLPLTRMFGRDGKLGLCYQINAVRRHLPPGRRHGPCQAHLLGRGSVHPRWVDSYLRVEGPMMPTRPRSDHTSTLISGGCPAAFSTASTTLRTRTSSAFWSKLSLK